MSFIWFLGSECQRKEYEKTSENSSESVRFVSFWAKKQNFTLCANSPSHQCPPPPYSGSYRVHRRYHSTDQHCIPLVSNCSPNRFVFPFNEAYNRYDLSYQIGYRSPAEFICSRPFLFFVQTECADIIYVTGSRQGTRWSLPRIWKKEPLMSVATTTLSGWSVWPYMDSSSRSFTLLKMLLRVPLCWSSYRMPP